MSSLVGIAQRPDEVIAYGGVSGRDDEQAAAFALQAIIGQRLYMKAGSVRGYLHLARHQAEAVP